MSWIKRRMQDKLPLLFLKNTVSIVIPAALIFGLLLAFTIRYPVLYRMFCRSAQSLEEIEAWNQRGCLNVSVQFSELNYIGYDYYEDDKRTGAYYYAFIENECVFVLVRTKEPEDVLEHVTVRGRILSDSTSLEAIKNELTSELGLDAEALDSVVYPLMLSEVDYPYLESVLLFLGIIAPFAAAGLLILSAVVWTIQPYRHPSAKAFNDFGERKQVYDEIRSQVKNRLLRHNYNYYLTEDYLIVSNLFQTDFVRIDYIRYISRHIIQKRGGRKQVYRLTMSNPEKMFYERDFDSEACADEIMTALIQLNPQIDNRTMKVFDLKPEENTDGEAQEAAEETANGEGENAPEKDADVKPEENTGGEAQEAAEETVNGEGENAPEKGKE